VTDSSSEYPIYLITIRRITRIRIRIGVRASATRINHAIAIVVNPIANVQRSRMYIRIGIIAIPLILGIVVAILIYIRRAKIIAVAVEIYAITTYIRGTGMNN
jgi:hypothetical protein